MTLTSIKEQILSFTDDVMLDYNEETIFINPHNDNKFELGYKDYQCVYTSIDALLSDPVIDGKSIADIAELIS